MPYRDPERQRRAQREANERRKLDPDRTRHRNDVRNATRRANRALGLPVGIYAKELGLGRRRPTEAERNLIRERFGIQSTDLTLRKVLSRLEPTRTKVVPITRPLGAVSVPTREPVPSVPTPVKRVVRAVASEVQPVKVPQPRPSKPKLDKSKQRTPTRAQQVRIKPRSEFAAVPVEPIEPEPEVVSALLRRILHTVDCDCRPCTWERHGWS